ncbi:MAG: hypothetical protein LBG22_08570 [Treponema sp.]|nr:hypothetical protein [Treponema sp.]
MNHSAGECSIVIPRTAYSLFIADFPRLRGRTLREALGDYLAGAYPGATDNAAKTPVIRKNGTRRGSYLIFVPREKRTGSMPASTLLVQHCLRGKDALAVFIGDGWIEYIRLEKGALIKSTVKNCPDLNEASFLNRLVAAFGPCGENPPPVNLFCTEADKTLLKTEDKAWIFHLLEKISCPEYRFSLYPHASPGFKRRKFLALLLGFCLGTAGFCILSQYREKTGQEMARLRRKEEERNRMLEQKHLAEQQLEELKRNYTSLAERKKTPVYEELELIARCLDGETLILSAVFKEGFFQFEAVSFDALGILASFEGCPRISSPILGQIRPQDGRERFTLSGAVLPHREEPGPELTIEEQQKMLEQLIEELEQPPAAGLSPASFGKLIRSLLQKWRCPVINYQYLDKSGEGEMEFTIRGESGGFFNFLREASSGVFPKDGSANSGFTEGIIFTLVQIRNLQPQNVVEAVFRVKCPIPLAGEEAKNQMSVPGNNTEWDNAILSALRISRNYAPPQKQKVLSKPESVPVSTEPPQLETGPVYRFEYLGTVSGSRGQFIYIKNTGTGAILALKLADAEDIVEGTYWIVKTGTITARINGKLYEMKFPALKT